MALWARTLAVRAGGAARWRLRRGRAWRCGRGRWQAGQGKQLGGDCSGDELGVVGKDVGGQGRQGRQGEHLGCDCSGDKLGVVSEDVGRQGRAGRESS